ncbi:MAG: hypothetical protein ACJAZ0_001107 [Halioglobus sp.]|jgi:general secretion pathway protein K
MGRTAQSGVALAIVVWFLAAMALLVSGIVFQAKIDTRLAQTHLARAKAEAAGDGAMNLMLAAVRADRDSSFSGRGVPSMDFEMGGLAITVELVPVSGLIDLNGASKALLAELFFTLGAVSIGEAELLADNVIKWRDNTPRGGGRAARFGSIEDLMKIEGVGRSLFDSVREAVVAGKSRRTGVDWASAPLPVLRVISGGDDALAISIVEGRSGDPTASTAVPSGLNAKFQLVSSSTRYRMDARVLVGDKNWLRRRWVALGAKKGSLLPWQFVRTEAARAVR